MVLGTSDCASRPVAPCTDRTPGPEPDLVALLKSCAPDGPDFYGTVRLELVNGCVWLFEMNGLGRNPTPINPYLNDLLPCYVQKLSSVRFSCGHEADCVDAEGQTEELR